MNDLSKKHQESFGPTLEALLQHKEWLRRLARSLVFDASQADDVVQQVFLSALKYRPSADRDMRPWLKVVATAVAKKIGRSEVRRNRREKKAAREDLLPLEERIAQLETSDTYRQLGEFLKNLEEPYRTILLRHHFEGIPLDEVGKLMGLSRSTVRNRYKRGIELLRARLDSRYGDRAAWGLLLLPMVSTPQPGAAAAPSSLVRGVGKKGFLGVAALLFLVPAGALLSVSMLAGSGKDGGEVTVPAKTALVEESGAEGSRTPFVAQGDAPNAPAVSPETPDDARNRAGGDPTAPIPQSKGPRAVNFSTGQSVAASLVPEGQVGLEPPLTPPTPKNEDDSLKPSKAKPPKHARMGAGKIQKTN